MFSFLNFIQSMLKKLKQNKGLWFTTLTVLSTLGIVLSMTLINFMSSNVAHKTYMKVHRVNTTHLETILDEKYDTLLSIGSMLSIHPDIVKNIKSKSDKSINAYLDTVQKTINTTVKIDPIIIRYYATDYKASLSENFDYADVVISSRTSISGVVVNKNGVRIMAITPVVDNNQTVGAIEVSQDISTVKNSFEKFGKEFVFLIDKTQLAFIDLEYKQGMIQDIDDHYKIFFHDYNSMFYTYLTHINIPKLLNEKYHVDKSFYVDAVEASDINGKIIGAYVIGETGESKDSFVSITQDLIKSVTTVALGLVISLILFMF